ncbi:competence/damage-inducible protein A [Candidatus Bathyarchaeota archaeon]|nr:competence/damage-inducible protein A [Candidatus Bathyarchaeota archaeon]
MAKTIGFLIIGNEILDGIVLESNSQWLTNRLKPLGFFVKERIIVRDDLLEIGQALKKLIEDGCNLIFTSGGLGPTHDDMTLKGIAQALNVTLELNQEALEIVTRQYAEIHKRGIIDSPLITPAREKMAYLPSASKPLDNKVGGAPGVLLIKDKITIICLPGVPSELMWIFDNQVIQGLVNDVDGHFFEDTISLPLRDESTLSPIIDEVMKKIPETWVKSLVKPYGESGIRIWISSRGKTKIEVENKVKNAKKLLLQLVNENLLEKL